MKFCLRMDLRRMLIVLWMVRLITAASRAVSVDEFIDRLDAAFTRSILDDRVRFRLSGTADIEYYHLSQPPPALISTQRNDLFVPRLSLFLDGQVGPAVYLFAQARVDRGFDPADGAGQMRLDEYAMRVTPWEDGRLSMQAGRFATVIGKWTERHLSWDNPFVTAPMVYEQPTSISDTYVPYSGSYFARYSRLVASYGNNPLIWGPVYASGISGSGRIGKFEYAVEWKNAGPSSRPESWDFTDVDFDHPTWSARLGYRPSPKWNFGVSASSGSYLRPEAEAKLPRSRGVGDYKQLILGEDVSFAWHHLQIWAEVYQVRFEVPRVGDADAFAYFVEAKYKFTPTLYGALRWNQQVYGDVPDGYGGDVRWSANACRMDIAAGFRFNAHTQLKIQYSVEKQDGMRGTSHLLASQLTLKF